MELSRLARLLRARWLLVAAGVVIGVGVGLYATDWLNGRITPTFEATAPVTYLAESGNRSEEMLQTARTIALNANSELLANRGDASITILGNQLLFTARAATAAEAQETAMAMRQAFHESDPSSEESLILMRLDEIVQELELLDSGDPSGATESMAGIEDEVLTAQLEALRQRLGSLAVELALLGSGAEDEARRLQIETELDRVGALIIDLESRLSSLASETTAPREQQLQRGALEVYKQQLISEYQTQYLRLLGKGPVNSDDTVAIVDRTPAPRPLSLTGALGGLAGALLALVALIASDMTRRPIWSRSDVEALTPTAVELPPRRPGRPSGQPWYPDAPSAARKRGVQALRADIEGAIEGRSASVGIVDLGCGPEQVATLTADLGAALAASGRNVLVIDANFEHTLRMPEFVTGTNKLADLLIHPSEDQEELLSFIKRTVNDQPEVLPGLRVFSSGSMEGDAIDVLAGRQLTVLLKEVGPVFDAVLVAMPGFGHPATDTLSQRLDYLLPVAKAGRSTIDSLEQTEKELRARRSSLLGGVVLTGRPVRSPRRRRAQNRHARTGGRPSPSRPQAPNPESADLAALPESPAGVITDQESDQIRQVEADEQSVHPAPSHSLTRRAAKTVFAAADVGKGDLPGPRILIYHQVGATLGREMEVSVDTFRQQLDWLGSHGEVVALENALLRVREAGSHRLFVLTFDDGYEDMYRNAFPLLMERSLPFTLYLTTEPVERQALITPGALASPLSWGQVAEMLDSGLITLGSHTHHHLDLRDLEPGRIVDELDTADSLIYRRTGVPVRHFAYPKGYWSEVAEPFVRERYVTAVLGAGEPVTDATDPHRIHRIPIQRSDGMAFFRRKMKSGMRMEETVRRRLKGYDGVLGLNKE